MNYDEYIKLNNENKFQYFMKTRFSTNRTPSYWVNWHNVLNNMEQYELSLNTLNYLVGKPNIEEEARKLFTEQPALLKSVPILLATRERNLNVLFFDNLGEMHAKKINFENPLLENLDEYISFMNTSGLFAFLKNDLKQSLVDYVFGVQAGLDSNARKNRSGSENEKILENNLKIIVNSNTNCDFLTQATRRIIKEKWNIDIPEFLQNDVRGGRRYDGVIYNVLNNKVTIVETNFYGSGGSKLKAVAGEFSSLYETSFKNVKNVNFVWISDGPGWDTAKNPLKEALKLFPT